MDWLVCKGLEITKKYQAFVSMVNEIWLVYFLFKYIFKSDYMLILDISRYTFFYPAHSIYIVSDQSDPPPSSSRLIPRLTPLAATPPPNPTPHVTVF